MPESVLVTGALGLVGRYTVNELATRGANVVATDLDTRKNRKIARRLRDEAEVRFADLTDAAAVDRLVQDVRPRAIVHLAAVIPPACYRNVRVARAVNVDAVSSLIRAAEQLRDPPRFVQASSVAVYGSRNPHRGEELLSASTPLGASDCYGQHKIEAEAAVRSSSLPYVILRLGAIISTQLRAMTVGSDQLFMEWSFPVDGRITTVDVRDVATAFGAATSADVVGRTLLIGGDESHRHRQGDVGPALVAAVGLSGVYPRGRVGDPDDNDEWFVCDWMDTAPAQEALQYQNHSWPQMLDEIHARTKWLRYPLRASVPFLRPLIARRSPYYRAPGRFATPWRIARARWPECAPDNKCG